MKKVFYQIKRDETVHQHSLGRSITARTYKADYLMKRSYQQLDRMTAYSYFKNNIYVYQSLEFFNRQHKRFFKAQFIKTLVMPDVLEESCFVKNCPYWFTDRWLRDIDI